MGSEMCIRDRDMGMDNVLDMEDGFTKWEMQDLPVDYLT
mgnify:CR=1 FL=1